MNAVVGIGWSRVGKQDVYLPILNGEKYKPIPASEIRSWLLAGENKQRIQDHLSWYFSQEYSGKHFEWFVAQSDSKTFTPWDILAVEALSVTVPTKTARWLFKSITELDEHRAEEQWHYKQGSSL